MTTMAYEVHRPEPMIESILDLDLYKLTMGQFVWKHFPDTKVRYELVNRHADRVPVAELISESELRQELAKVRDLSLTESEKNYLLESPHLRDLFSREFVEWFSKLRLPALQISRVGDQYQITAEGLWSETIYWETIVLSVVNELIGRAYEESNPDFDWCSVGYRELSRKFSMLSSVPFAPFVEFGTRRRWSKLWQKKVIETALRWGRRINFAGTSNVHLAHQFGIKPVGTFAHEMPMALAAMAAPNGDEALRQSHDRFIEMWWQMYGEDLSIALTDTWGADFFFEDFGEENAKRWKGLRHDSGDPREWAQKAIAYYEECGINPRDKMLLFSDGLEIEKIVTLYRDFSHRAKVAFGWGTDLTNKVGFKPTSMVMKIFEVDGVPTVKLSDNLAKAMGPKSEVERYSRVFEHSGSDYTRTKY